jgi:hypothetical protein
MPSHEGLEFVPSRRPPMFFQLAGSVLITICACEISRTNHVPTLQDDEHSPNCAALDYPEICRRHHRIAARRVAPDAARSVLTAGVRTTPDAVRLVDGGHDVQKGGPVARSRTRFTPRPCPNPCFVVSRSKDHGRLRSHCSRGGCGIHCARRRRWNGTPRVAEQAPAPPPWIFTTSSICRGQDRWNDQHQVSQEAIGQSRGFSRALTTRTNP